MTEHVFLTGRKQVGKSTLIRKELERYKKENGEGKIGGFLTVRTDAVYDGKYSVHMLRAGTESDPSEENLLFICGSADSSRPDERFDRMGSRILEESVRNGAELLVMDELGPNEAGALVFQEAVLRALDGDIPILGVLQEADSAFLKKVAAHPKVRVIRVTEENRDALKL